VQGGADTLELKNPLMTIDYKIDRKDLTEYLIQFLKKSKTIKRTLLIFNLLAVSAICLILLGIITKWIWCFVIGVSFIGLNAYRPSLKKEATKKVSELEKENKLKTCFGLINLTVEKDGLTVTNGQEEERIPASNLTNIQLDAKYLTIGVTHGLLFIPLKRFATTDDKLKLINAIENVRLGNSV
jgi:hypothetical protein